MAYKFKKPVEKYLAHITTDVLKEIYENHGFEVELKKEVYHDATFLTKQLEISVELIDEYIDYLQNASVDILVPLTYGNTQKRQEILSTSGKSIYSTVFLPYYNNISNKLKNTYEINENVVSMDKYQLITSNCIEAEFVGG